MKERHACDVIVIGASVGGLAAAAYLAHAGLSVLLVEARNVPGGLCASAPLGEGFSVPLGAHALYALDPKLVRDLGLARRGLGFAVRDMALVGLRPDGRHVVVTRDVRATARALAIHSKSDGEAWPHRRRELYALARMMRPHWWNAGGTRALDALAQPLQRFRRMGVAPWLETQFESDVLKATLAFDAIGANLSTLEPGSALTLLWRAAQEMCGHQGAAAVPRGGPGALASALALAAKDAGADIRTGARVTRIHVVGHAVEGVELASGNTIAAPRVLSALSRRTTLCDLLAESEAGFAGASACDRARARVGAAKVILTLDAQPAFGGIATPADARFILADGAASYATAHAEAETGQIPHEPPIEFTFPTASDPALAPMGQHVLSAVIRPLPVAPTGGWEVLKPALVRALTAALSAHAPELARRVTHAEVVTPDDFAARFGHAEVRGSVAHMLSDWEGRIRTPIAGLMLCGAAAEPVAAVSGRAGRIAAQIVLREMKL